MLLLLLLSLVELLIWYKQFQDYLYTLSSSDYTEYFVIIVVSYDFELLILTIYFTIVIIIFLFEVDDY